MALKVIESMSLELPPDRNNRLQLDKKMSMFTTKKGEEEKKSNIDKFCRNIQTNRNRLETDRKCREKLHVTMKGRKHERTYL